MAHAVIASWFKDKMQGKANHFIDLMTLRQYLLKQKHTLGHKEI